MKSSAEILGNAKVSYQYIHIVMLVLTARSLSYLDFILIVAQDRPVPGPESSTKEPVSGLFLSFAALMQQKRSKRANMLHIQWS